MIPKPVIQLAEAAAPAVREVLENPAAVFSAFEKAAYEAWPVAPRVADAGIRTVENIGAAAVKLGDDAVQVADGAMLGSTPFRLQPSMLIPGVSSETALRSAPAHFAQMIHTDMDAFKAVSTFERPAIGFTPRMVEIEATQEQMQKTAMEGALAYLGMGGTANKYTQFLVSRFGSV